MSNIASLAGIASLIGEPTRTAMLVTLMDGRALTAGELAAAAGVSAPTASEHLARLLEAGLLALERQGRHRYYRLSGPSVAATLEGLMALDTSLAGAARPLPRPIVTGPRDNALRRARTCYDHLAGRVAVAIADSMVARGELDLSGEGAALTGRGHALLAAMEVSVARRERPAAAPAIYCRPCLDWSERRPHLGGALGAAMYRAFVERGWMRPAASGRVITVSPFGMAELTRYFDLPPE